jgi:hypothetical protein
MSETLRDPVIALRMNVTLVVSLVLTITLVRQLSFLLCIVQMRMEVTQLINLSTGRRCSLY